jgi:glycosyltransferase involved in cell wall biosynthesis
VVLSFVDITNITVLLASVGLRLPVVIAERTYPPSHRIGLLWETMRRVTYPFCRRLVVQTSAVADWARSYLPARRIATIPNAVPRFALGHAGATERRRVILGVGRLVPEKGFDLLIRAFSLSGLGPVGWRLVILGEGPERGMLEKLCFELGVADWVELPGEVRDPVAQLLSSGIFALSSRYEGFPNVLLEAMACGAVPIAFDCLSGPRDVITDGINGTLVPEGDIPALAAALSCLAHDPARRSALAGNAVRVAIDYSPDVILDRWTELLECYA